MWALHVPAGATSAQSEQKRPLPEMLRVGLPQGLLPSRLGPALSLSMMCFSMASLCVGLPCSLPDPL